MRLICPNCDAQYEVPDDVIPADGRDVQCSNCGNTWFQAGHDMAEPAEPDDAIQSATAPAEDPDPQPEPETQTPDSVAEDTLPRDSTPGPEASSDAAPVRRELDPDVASVLREEAEHEARVRAAESATLESQPDLGLDEPDAPSEADLRAQQARDRMARLRGQDPEAVQQTSVADVAAVTAATAAAGNSRRDMLPDIEEINSTLRSSSEPRPADPTYTADTQVPPPEKKGGFRRGFLWILLLFVMALLVYLYADQIVAALPQAEGPIGAYVATINDARIWLDAQVLNVLGMLDGMASESADAPATDGN